MPNAASIYARNAANSFYAPIFVLDASNQVNIGETTSSLATPIRFFTSGSATPNAVITTAGNLGIGTTTPTSQLHLYNASGVSTMRMTANAASQVAIYLGDTANTVIGAIAYENSNDSMFFQTNAAERLRITSAGNVGIGTSTPNQRLSIYANGADAAIEFSTVSGSAEKWTVGIDDSDAAKFKISSSSVLGTNDRFVIDGSGKVGIGDSTPLSLLTVGSGDLFQVNSSGTVLLGSAGVSITGDGDGGITFLGLGNGSDENLKLDLDNSGNTGVFTSSTGLSTITFSNISPNTTSANGYQMFGAKVFYASTSSQTITIGQNAGPSINGLALENIFLGHNAGFTATSTSYNVFIGGLAGQNNTSGNQNIFLGYNAANANTKGSNNQFFGYQAGAYNKTGNQNVMIGDYAGWNLNATRTVAIGYQALYTSALAGNQDSIGIGYSAGFNAGTSASANIIIGSSAGSGINSSNNIIIGNSAGVASGNYKMNIGNIFYADSLNGTDASNVSIGSTTASQKLYLHRTSGDAGIGFSTASGATEKWSIGIDESDAAKFKISSSSVLGTNDRFVIDGAGKVGINDATPNAFFDIDTPTTYTSGTIYGSAAAGATTLAGSLTGFNMDLSTNYTATNNNVTGFDVSLPVLTNTTASIYTSRGMTISGNTLTQNTAAGIINFTGAFITNPDITAITGGGLVNANGVSVTTGTIGSVSANQKGFNVIAAGVGNGTLHGVSVSAITAGAGTEYAVNIGAGWDYGIYNASRLFTSSDFASGYAGEFFNDGNVANRWGLKVQAGLDDSTAAGPSTLINFADGDGTTVGSITFGSSVTAYNTTSDERLKTNIVDTNVGITQLMQVKVRDFNWKADADKSTLTTGFIAQELAQIYPQAVTIPKNLNDIWMVDYSKLMPLVIAGVQDQNVTVTEQGVTLGSLGEQLLTAIKSVADLEAAVSSGLSENYHTEDETIEAGELVALATTSDVTIRRAHTGDEIFGVVSENAGIVLGDGMSSAKPVALTGRVAVKVNDEGGDIEIGDAITISTEDGIGTKATTTTRVIGTALEASDDDTDTIHIYVSPQLHYAWNETAAVASLFQSIENNEEDTLWGRITTLASNFVDGILTVAGIKTDELCVGDVCVDEATFLKMVQDAGGSGQSNNNGGDNTGGGEVTPPPEPTEPDPVEPPVYGPDPIEEPPAEIPPPEPEPVVEAPTEPAPAS